MHTLEVLEILRSFCIDLSLDCLLEDVSDHETLLFTEYRTEDLETDRKFDRVIILRGGESDRNHESRNTSERCRNREDIFEVECEWIISLLTDLPCDRRRCRRDDDIDQGKCLSKILTDQFSYTSRLSIIRIIETR